MILNRIAVDNRVIRFFTINDMIEMSRLAL
jgi:hypothetical protein